MSQLHVFSSLKSFQRAAPVLSSVSADDAGLLRADALYQLLSDADCNATARLQKIYAIKSDALARGIDPAQFAQIEWIDYPQWVALCVTHASSINW